MSTFQTLSYSDSSDVKGWPSFYSFPPDYMIGMNGYFYSWSGGDLYRHNTNELRNNYYGVQYGSKITSVFNVEPQTIKLFKTMSYESDDRWACTELFTDLNTGSMLSTFFDQKEGEWYTFIRENSSTINLKDRSVNGLGTANTINGPVNAVVIDFTVDVGSIVSVGDSMFFGSTPTFGGIITSIVPHQTVTPLGVTTLASITVDCTTGATPPVNSYILYVKNPVAESSGARGYYMHFTLENTNTKAVELFSVGSSVMKKFSIDFIIFALMKFNVIPLKDTDYDKILCKWWKDWRWSPPSKDFLPQNGMGGFMVYDGDIPICAGFMYVTNSKAVWCDWIISNLEYKDRQNRKEALELLIKTISDEAKKEGAKYVYALIKNKPLVDAYKKYGFVEGDMYTQELIKTL